MSVPRLFMHHSEIDQILNPETRRRKALSKRARRLLPISNNNNNNMMTTTIDKDENNNNDNPTAAATVATTSSASPTTPTPTLLTNTTIITTTTTQQQQQQPQQHGKRMQFVIKHYLKFEQIEAVLNDVRQIAEDLADLPTTASHKWNHLALLMLALALGSAIVPSVVFFFPFHSVNEGLEGNRRFLYGLQTLFELLAIVPWADTCNFAMEDVTIPRRARIVSIVIAMMVMKFFDAYIAEGWWMSGLVDPVFPIPFSTIVSGTIALPFAIFSLYTMTPHTKAKDEKFRICIKYLLKLLVCIFLAGLWATVFVILMGSRWQRVWAFSFAILQMLCKVLFVAPTAVELNKKRYTSLVLIVDIIFTRVQFVTLPYISGVATLALLLVPSLVAQYWRFYSGLDRLKLWVVSLWRLAHQEELPISTTILKSKNLFDISKGIALASLSEVHEIGIVSSADVFAGFSKRVRKLRESRRVLNISSIKHSHDDELLTTTTSHNEVLDASHKHDDDDDDDDELIDLEKGGGAGHDTTDSDINQVVDRSTGLCMMMLSNATPLESIDEEYDDDLESEFDSDEDNDLEMQADITIVQNKSTETEDSCRSLQEEEEEHEEEEKEEKKEKKHEEVQEEEQEEKQLGDDDNDDDMNDNLEEEDVVVQLESHLDLRQAFQLTHERFHRYLDDDVDDAATTATTTTAVDGGLMEIRWEQRQLFHIVDSIGAEVLSSIVQIHTMFYIILAHHLPVRNHLNGTFNVSDEIWRRGIIYGWIFIFTNLLIIASLSLVFRRVKALGDKQLTMQGILSYNFRDNFWFFFLWLMATSSWTILTLINHFGADFTLSFDWLSCRGEGEMAWPGCVKK